MPLLPFFPILLPFPPFPHFPPVPFSPAQKTMTILNIPTHHPITPKRKTHREAGTLTQIWDVTVDVVDDHPTRGCDPEARAMRVDVVHGMLNFVTWSPAIACRCMKNPTRHIHGLPQQVRHMPTGCQLPTVGHQPLRPAHPPEHLPLLDYLGRPVGRSVRRPMWTTSPRAAKRRKVGGAESRRRRNRRREPVRLTGKSGWRRRPKSQQKGRSG